MSSLQERPLEGSPDFYRSLAGNAYIGRLDGNLNTKTNLHQASEIIEYKGVCQGLDIYFDKVYKTRPLIRGIKHQQITGYNLLLPSDSFITVYKNRINVSSNIFVPTDNIDYLKFRVYSLDNDNNAITSTIG